MSPTWVRGIGPPLEQIEDDLLASVDGVSRDALLLVREVYRLRAALQRIADGGGSNGAADLAIAAREALDLEGRLT